MKTLDELGLQHGTDKASSRGEAGAGHDYLRHYDVLLSPLREREFDMIEIGVLGGASLRMWQDYFPKARVLGLDITEACKGYESARVRIELGRHDDIGFIRGVAARERPLVVVDDGSHVWSHQIDLFETLFPSVQPGGIYVCEDLQVCFGAPAERYGSPDQQTSARYFAALSERVLGDRPAKFALPLERYLLSWIDAMYFSRGAVIVRKRQRELFPLERHPRTAIDQAKREAARKAKQA